MNAHCRSQITADIHKSEKILRHILSFQSRSAHNRRHTPSLAYTGINRHASDTRIGLMDSTVPIEALVNG